MPNNTAKPAARQLHTLQHLIDRIGADPTLSNHARQNWSAAMRGLARGARKSPALLPANATKFNKAITADGVSHLNAEVSPATWRQYWHGWRSAARHCGLLIGQARNTTPRSEKWNACLAGVSEGDRKNLTRFAGEMSRHGIEPAEVRLEHFQLFRNALDKAAVCDPERSFKAFSDGWRNARAAGAGLPDIDAPIAHKKIPFWRDWSEFPASLEADIEAYYAGRMAPKAFDIADLLSKPTGKMVRPATVVCYKNYLQSLAGAAVAAGIPPEQLTSLEALLDLATLKKAFEYLVSRRLGLRRRDGATEPDKDLMRGGYHYNIAHHALTILRRHFRVPGKELDDLIGCVEQLAPKNKGMAPTTRAQLDVLCQRAVVNKIFTLPDRLFAEIAAVEEPGPAEAWTAALALALAIGLDTAFRRSNIVGLDTDRHFGRVDPKSGRLPVEIPEDEAKTAQVYVGELRLRTVKLLETYLSRWRRLIFPGETTLVFPDQTGACANAARFGARLARLVRRRIGTDFSMHRIRGVLATIYAEENPGDEKTAQTKLGHRDPRTTHKFYTAPQHRKANRRFDAVIDELVAGTLPVRSRRPAEERRHGQL